MTQWHLSRITDEIEPTERGRQEAHRKEPEVHKNHMVTSEILTRTYLKITARCRSAINAE